MAQTTCAKCGGHRFQLAEHTLINAAYKMNIAQCTSCGAPIGITPYYDPGIKAKNVEEKVDKLEREIDDIKNILYNIQNRLR